MKNLIWVILLFVGAVLVAFGAQYASGSSVIFLIAQHRVEISFNFFIILVLLAFVALWFLFRFLRAIWRIPSAVRRVKDEHAQKMFNRALLAFFEGQFKESLKYARQAYRRGKWQGLSALLAAHSAVSLNEEEVHKEWLTLARQADEEFSNAATLLEAQSALKESRFNEVLNILTQLPPKFAASNSALLLDLFARQGLKEGEAVLTRLKLIHKKGALKEEVLLKLREEATLNALNEAGKDLEKLKKFLGTWIPQNVHEAEMAVDALLLHNDESSAQKWIEKYLSEPERLEDAVSLFARYAALKEGEEKKRIAQAEKWLAQTPNNSALLLALGQMCLKAQLWGKAQNYLEAAVALNQNLEAHLELARLLDQLNRPDDANKHYRALAHSKEKENVAQNL